ncbi:MAG TPA: SDR family oxidoreductase [Ktedonobacteraceae bacterium]|jgi:decaprenylphospho-beta-D-erythro-pentofuranosid-2-ulose 2-reductase|nr:SDR family oxidoreductase [Ktedonobacteraceae bacterium]
MKMMIVGATSAIAHETAKCFARDGAEFFLVARNTEKLQDVSNDLKVRGAKRAETFLLDVNELERHEELVDAAVLALDGLDAVLISHGTLGDQQKSEHSVSETLKEFTTNCTSVISLLTLLANYFEQQKRGCIAVVSSVAGDRGRKSNYVYGSAKAAVTAFLSGLRGRLSSTGVTVITVKPGLVDTPMTASLKKGLLFASPSKVGAGIYQAMQKKKEVVYLPWFWRYIMLIVKMIPEPVFKRLSF